MIKNWKCNINNFLTKAIIFNLYLFALGLFTSKALTSASGIFVCLFGLLRVIIIKENPIKKITDKVLNLPILFFIIALIISMVEHPNEEAFSQFQKHLLLFLFFYFATFNLDNLKQIKKIILISSLSMGIAVVYGFYQHYILELPRVESFATPLGYGCLLAIFIIFTFVYGIWGKLNLRYRISLLISNMFLGANLLFTQTRGAWLGLIGGVFALSWFKTKKILFFLIIIGLILYMILPQVYIDKFISSFDVKKDPSNLGRIALWKGAVLMYRDHFVNGVGLGRFSTEYETNYMQPHTTATCHAHNNLLQFMAETGTIGLIAFVWLMTAIMAWLYKNYLHITNHNWRLFFLASFCGLIAFHIQGLTEVNYGDAETLRFFWFLTAINMAVVKIFKEKNNQSTAGNN